MREGRGASSASGGAGLRRALVISQVAFSFVLLFGALLFTATLRNLLAVDTGFQTEDMTVARVDFSTLELPDGASVSFKRDLLDRIRGIPGVASAAEVRHVPMGGTGSSITVRPDGPSSNEGVPIRINGVTEGFLQAMGISLISGRTFDEGDTGETAVAIVNPTFARRVGLDGDPVGQRFDVEETDLVLEVVGLVPDTKYFDLREEPIPIAFVPRALFPDPRSHTDFVVRSSLPPGNVRASVARALSPLGSRIRTEVRPFGELIREDIRRERLMAGLSGFFGILAAMVAAIGLYGVLSYLVVRRTTDIGVRMALGARKGDILWMVFRHAGILLAVGLAVGAVLSLAAGRAADAFLFGLEPYDIGVLGQTIALFGAVAAIACFIPARRAARMEPRMALREE